MIGISRGNKLCAAAFSAPLRDKTGRARRISFTAKTASNNFHAVVIFGGKLEINLGPMAFMEFAREINPFLASSLTLETVVAADSKTLHGEMMKPLRLYLLVGGMPECVQRYCEMRACRTWRRTCAFVRVSAESRRDDVHDGQALAGGVRQGRADLQHRANANSPAPFSANGQEAEIVP